MTTAPEHADNTGEIAITSRTGHTLLHLLRSPDGEATRTICGRYTFARHTGQERVDEDTKTCQVCWRVYAENAPVREAKSQIALLRG